MLDHAQGHTRSRPPHRPETPTDPSWTSQPSGEASRVALANEPCHIIPFLVWSASRYEGEFPQSASSTSRTLAAKSRPLKGFLSSGVSSWLRL